MVLPGLAVTLLITPIALDMAWPQSTLAALVVFTISMLGLALTPPPPAGRAGPAAATGPGTLVFVIGLLAGGAGLAGSLATQRLTLFTLGGAIGVGGWSPRSSGAHQRARILGWLFAAVMGQFFVLTVGWWPGWPARLGGVRGAGGGRDAADPRATLPRLGRPEAQREATTVEWSGYGRRCSSPAPWRTTPPGTSAALLAAWGAVLGRGRRPARAAHRWSGAMLFWRRSRFEIVAWCCS